ncbi:hypothetical protein ACFWZY_01145 [Streptomyces sp. NPDC058992]|uniref:hypothetical protein n=1 Tax=Streptomyces sp. NPDC058992 TaxID=3346688 RepID=UPI0036A8E5D4
MAAVAAAAGFAAVVGTTTIAAAVQAGADETNARAAVAEDKADGDEEKGYAPEGDEGGGRDAGDDGSGGRDAGGEVSGEHEKADGEGYGGRDAGDDGSGGRDAGGEVSGEHEKADGDQEKADGEGTGRHGERNVECDPNDLIAAIVDLNQNSGGSLRLAKQCTYTLTANQDGNGLPEIIQPISIHGNGSTIQRAANTDQFRFFQVGAGGDLKLSHLFLTRGKSAPDENGGAILVDPAGRLHLEMVALDRNTVDSIDDEDGDDGGAVYNAGITNVVKSTFEGNSADEGSAIYNGNGKLKVDSAKFYRNIGDDGAIENVGGTSTIVNSDIRYNIGGGVESDGGVTEVEKSVIAFNTDDGTGGGIDHEAGGLHVRGTHIHDNTAATNGGGLQVDDETVIEDSEITGNTALGGNDFVDGRGGGIDILPDQEVEAEVEVAIRNTKIAGNQVPGDGGRGGGIFVNQFGRLVLTDSKVTKNISDEPAGGVDNEGTVVTHGKVRIIDNVPTNCEGSTNPVPNCFG